MPEGSSAKAPDVTRTLPVGLELDGPAWSDRRLLAIAQAVERVFGALPALRPERMRVLHS